MRNVLNFLHDLRIVLVVAGLGVALFLPTKPDGHRLWDQAEARYLVLVGLVLAFLALLTEA